MISDLKLRTLGKNWITPFNESRIQPSSYDLALGPHLLLPAPYKRIDLRTDEPKDHMRSVTMEDEYELHPGDCVLGATEETVHCPSYLTARIEGKSSLGRLFLAVHITAGVIDSGFKGQLTLEIVNHGPWTVVLWPGMMIAQLSFMRLEDECETLYGSQQLLSHYQGQTGPVPAAGKRGK